MGKTLRLHVSGGPQRVQTADLLRASPSNDCANGRQLMPLSTPGGVGALTGLSGSGAWSHGARLRSLAGRLLTAWRPRPTYPCRSGGSDPSSACRSRPTLVLTCPSLKCGPKGCQESAPHDAAPRAGRRSPRLSRGTGEEDLAHEPNRTGSEFVLAAPHGGPWRPSDFDAIWRRFKTKQELEIRVRESARSVAARPSRRTRHGWWRPMSPSAGGGERPDIARPCGVTGRHRQQVVASYAHQGSLRPGSCADRRIRIGRRYGTTMM
jgi:hypothetical protein